MTAEIGPAAGRRERVMTAVIRDFFARKTRIIILIILCYAALC